MQAIPPKPHVYRFRVSRLASSARGVGLLLSVWLVVLSLAGCGVVYNTLPLTVDPASVAFGSVQVGKNETATVTLHNSGLKDVTLNGMQSADPAFTVPSTRATIVPSGGSATVQVVFAPSAAKDYATQVLVSSNSGQTTFNVSGTGAQASPTPREQSTAALNVSTTALQFGSVPIGGDAQQTVTVTSTGTAPLIITSLSTSGSGFSAQAPALPMTLAPNQSLNLPVSFGPTASGSALGQLAIGSNAATTPSVTVALAGNGASSSPVPPGSGGSGPILTLSSTAVDFGSVAVGSQESQSVTLISNGSASVVIESISVDGSVFAAGQLSLPLTLAPGQQIALPLTFAPTAAGMQQGQVTLVDNTTAGSASIRVSGTGHAAPKSSSLSVPATVNFGDATDGSSSSKTMTLVAGGTTPVTVKSVTVSGGAFSASALVLPQVLQPNQQMSVRLNFTPTSEGNATGSVRITSDATTDPSASATLQGNGIAATAPALSASATALSFGNVAIQSSATQTLTVTSTGTAPATITAGTLTGSGFSATYAGVGIRNLASKPITLQPGQQAAFQIVFDPSQTGTASGQLSLSTDTGTPITVTLSGQGTVAAVPAVTLSASSLDFGDVEQGQQATQTLTVTSSGTAPLTIFSSAIVGQGFQVASVAYPAGVSKWPVTLNAGQQVALTVVFRPNAVAAFNGSLALTTNASGGGVNVPLSGTGEAVPVAAMQLSATSIAFGSVSVGSTASQSLTITSNGSAALTITAIDVSGPEFSGRISALPLTLQPGQQLSLPLTFTPTANGAVSGTVTIISNAPTGPASIVLGGTGTTATTPQLTANASVLSFGSVTVNASANQALTLTSSGTAPLTITAANVIGAGFNISGATFPITLQPSQSVQLQVTFDPAAPGPASGTLTIASNSAGGATTTVQLSGTGTAAATSAGLSVSSQQLAFGNVAVASSSALPLTLISSGSAPLIITAASITGNGFSVSGATFPITLQPGQSAQLKVTFDPAAAGAVSGTLTIASNSAAGATTTVQLSGTGTVVSTSPLLQISATSLAFGNVAVGATSTQNLTLVSAGSSPLTINSVGLTGNGFSESGGSFPVTLNPNQSVTLEVQFDPAAAGAASGTLTITSNSGSGATIQVSIIGTGTAVQHWVDLNWDAPTGSSDLATGYNVYRSANGGSTFTRLNSSTDSNVSYTDNNVQSGSTYLYQVTSVDASGIESAPSNQITLTIP